MPPGQDARERARLVGPRACPDNDFHGFVTQACLFHRRDRDARQRRLVAGGEDAADRTTARPLASQFTASIGLRWPR